MKKIINDPKNYIDEMLKGVVANSPHKLLKLTNFDVITRKRINPNKVALISGGGAGHEPAHGGFVGYGMLDAAIAGPIFTSPTPNQIEAAIEAVTGEAGALLIIKSYTGDRLNFEAGRMLAETKDFLVNKVIVADDVAIPNADKLAGARGLAGTIFIHKIAGAKAEAGGSLTEVTTIANEVINNVRTMSIALDACVVPEIGKPSFILKEDEVEFGLGIHGEPGIKKMQLPPAHEIVRELLVPILEDHFYLDSEVAVIVNGLGGTPISELHIMNHNLQTQLQEKGIKVFKTLVGNFVTSLEMKGASISLLKLTEEMKILINSKADTLAWTELGEDQ